MGRQYSSGQSWLSLALPRTRISAPLLDPPRTAHDLIFVPHSRFAAADPDRRVRAVVGFAIALKTVGIARGIAIGAAVAAAAQRRLG